jgi:hypothetical protein
MKSYYSSIQTGIILIAIMLLSIPITASCNSNPSTPIIAKESFVIYLAENREVVLTEHEINLYDPEKTILELNEDGIEKWNSHITYHQDVPKLADGLFSQEFIIEIEGKEICRGKFWSTASSASFDGVVILDSLFRLDSEHNFIQIQSGYPVGEQYIGTSSALYDYFSEKDF